MAIKVSMDLKELHDELLANAPSDAEHDSANCPYCAPSGKEGASEQDSLVGGGDMTTFTQDDLNAAVAEAVKPLNDRIQELEQASEQSEIEARVAREKADLEAQVAELQAKLDTAVLEAEQAKKDHADVLAYLEDVKAQEEAAAEQAARRDARLAVVREVANFPEEHIEASAERWAALSDEAFESLVADWKAIASKEEREEEENSSETLGSTALETASRDRKASAVTEVIGLISSGFDPRTV